ncbi:putative non-specific serine/threonine protein kinase [Helianthus annuus]|nr:putative non-specific serine/threonine protein kinase [Helianthus annuus]
MVSSMFTILAGIAGMCFGIRRRKLIRLREKFFEQNGGLLLKQKIKSQQSNEAMTLFSIEQLRKATNNYAQEQIIGKGAYGVVYKGVLLDKRVVAIKKSKLVDATQAE